MTRMAKSKMTNSTTLSIYLMTLGKARITMTTMSLSSNCQARLFKVYTQATSLQSCPDLTFLYTQSRYASQCWWPWSSSLISLSSDMKWKSRERRRNASTPRSSRKTPTARSSLSLKTKRFTPLLFEANNNHPLLLWLFLHFILFTIYLILL